MTRSDALAISAALVIRHIRVHELHITQKALGDRAGLSQGYIANMERAYRTLSLPVFERIANALDIPPGALLSRVVDFADSDLEAYLEAE